MITRWNIHQELQSEHHKNLFFCFPSLAWHSLCSVYAGCNIMTRYKLQNNNDFRDECIRWDKEQEERKRLEESQKELAQQQALSGNTGHASTSLDPNNDVLVSFKLCIS